jgi:hypothetical protein
MASNRRKLAAKELRTTSPDESAHVLPENSALDAVIAIAEERNGYLERMREALLSGDDVQLKLYARKLCGLPSEPQPETQQSTKPTIKRKRT